MTDFFKKSEPGPANAKKAIFSVTSQDWAGTYWTKHDAGVQNPAHQPKDMKSKIHTNMKTTSSITLIVCAAITLLASVNLATATMAKKAVDDFSDPKRNSIGIDRLFLDDTTAGGKTSTEYRVEDGVLFAKGDIQPPRGQPGWASAVLLLDPQGLPVDASQYEGIRLRVRIHKGTLSISANSTEITNYDYHAAVITRQTDGEFHEVRIPFSSMKRAWSEQTPLNTKTIASISLVSFELQKASFDFEVDEVSFY